MSAHVSFPTFIVACPTGLPYPLAKDRSTLIIVFIYLLEVFRLTLSSIPMLHLTVSTFLLLHPLSYTSLVGIHFNLLHFSVSTFLACLPNFSPFSTFYYAIRILDQGETIAKSMFLMIHSTCFVVKITIRSQSDLVLYGPAGILMKRTVS